MSFFADIIGELLIDVFFLSSGPGREDARSVRGLPRDTTGEGPRAGRSELGFDDVRAFVMAVLDEDDVAVEEVDLEGNIVYVAFAENSGEDVTVGAWGLSDGMWALTVSADSTETWDTVAKAVVRTIRSG